MTFPNIFPVILPNSPALMLAYFEAELIGLVDGAASNLEGPWFQCQPRRLNILTEISLDFSLPAGEHHDFTIKFDHELSLPHHFRLIPHQSPSNNLALHGLRY